MNFTTFEFLLFLAAFFPIYFILPKNFQKFALLIFNFYYISFYKIEFLYFILGISTLFYVFGILIEKYKSVFKLKHMKNKYSTYILCL